MTVKELIKRYSLLAAGLFVSAVGVAITKHGELGVSPISSVANVLSLKFAALSLGSWLIVWNCVLIVAQVIILRKKFRPVQLLQIPVSFLFGWFTDFGTWCVSRVPTDMYIVRLALVAAGVMILGLGISISVAANVVMNSGEAFVKAVSGNLHKKFGNVKICFDIGCVALSVLMSLLFFGGAVKGTREGTLIAAVFTGLSVKLFSPIVNKPLNRFFEK